MTGNTPSYRHRASLMSAVSSCLRLPPLPARAACVAAALLAPSLLPAAISDVIVWDSIRTTTQLQNTLANGYSSTTGMRLWWKFNNASNLGADATGHGHTGIVKGVVSGLTMPDEFGVSRTVATGFNHESCYVVGNPGFTNGATADRTYELWIRNPAKNGSVFFSITDSELGGGDDIKRMWVNADGSLTIADYGSDAPRTQSFTSGPLTWNTDQWYQIVVIFDHTSGNYHTCKVYRGTRPSTLTLLFNYTGSSDSTTQTEQWLAVGGHEAGYYSTGSGKAGYLGCDGPGTSPTVTPETYGAYGDGSHDDTAAWRKACAVISAYGQGTLQLTAGKTYKVGKETINTSSTTPYYNYDGLGWIVGAREGKITVNGNGATVKLADNMHFGGFDPTTGAPDSSITNPLTQDKKRLHAADPGDLLKVENCVDVEVKSITLHGNVQNQIWGGTYADAGYQCVQSGINLVGNDAVWLHDIECYYNGKDGINVTNDDLDATSDLKTVLIERAYSYYNGRQGLSYNCGNHLEVYDSVFAHTGRIKANKPGAGVDVEPMGRYMAEGALFDGCKFFDNSAPGVLLTGAPACIIRDSTIWGTTTFAAKSDKSTDHDHLFLRCEVYGGYYHNGAARVRFDQCAFHNPEQAYFSANYPNADVAKKHGIEQVGGTLVVSECSFEALQGNWNTSNATDPATIKAHSVYLTNAAVQSSTFKHGNWKGTGSWSVGTFRDSYLVNTKFTETGIFASHPADKYYIADGGTTNPAAIGPGCSIEGPSAGSDHYVSWGNVTTARPLPAGPISSNIADGVLTPNAAAGEYQFNTGATYTASPAFTNPQDTTGTRLFDKDQPYDDWSNACGLNYVDQTVTIDLKSARSVRAVKLRMKHTQKPLRVYVSVGDGTNWTQMGLIRPTEVQTSALAPWFDATVATPLTGRYVKLSFENDGLWGWYINEVKVYGF